MYKSWTKRLIALCLITVFTSALIGCGKGQSSSQKEITINFPSIWVAKDAKAPAVTEIIKQFNDENAGKIKVVVEEMPDYQAYRDKMRTNITSGSAPDVFSFDSPSDLQLFSKSGKLMDLTPYLDKGWKNDFQADALKSVAINGKYNALPFEFGVTPVLYNSRLFEKAGIKEFPKTYTEFFDACDKLKAAGITPMSQMTGENAFTSMLWYSQLVVAIGGPDVWNNGLSDPAFVEAAKMMKKMYDYTTKDAIGAGAAVSAGHWLNEQTAMLMNGPWFIGRIKKEGINNMYDQVKIAPAPVYEGGKGKQGGYIGFIQAYLAFGKQSDKNKEEAVIKFAQFLTKPDNVKKISLTSGSLFVVNFDIKPEDKADRLQAEMITQLKNAPYAVPHFQASMKPAVVSEFPQALSSMLLGKTTPEQFVEDLKSKDEL